MKITQALVTIGGTGSKLKKDGVDVPISKSFLMLSGQPLFYWCLFGLYHAGITHLVVVADTAEKLLLGEKTLASFPHSFVKVDLFEDEGLGTTGLPWHARHLLKDEFFFEYGHSISEPDHYRTMSMRKRRGSVVLSAFRPVSDTLRPYVRIEKDRITRLRAPEGDGREFVVGSPSLIDHAFVGQLPSFDFNSYRILDHYLALNKVELVISRLPVEIDDGEEMSTIFPVYQDYVRKRYGAA